MTIKDKVVSLSLAKRMAELGWNYETERYWNEDITMLEDKAIWLSNKKGGDFSILAPDAIEIGKRLPYRIESGEKWYDFWLIKHADGSWIFAYAREAERKTLKIFNNENLSEALGKMWCYLKEKGLI